MLGLGQAGDQGVLDPVPQSRLGPPVPPPPEALDRLHPHDRVGIVEPPEQGVGQRSLLREVAEVGGEDAGGAAADPVVGRGRAPATARP